MSKGEGGFIFLFLLLFIFACTSTKEIKKPPQFTFEDPILSKGMYHKGTSGIPVDRTTTFSTADRVMWQQDGGGDGDDSGDVTVTW